MYSDKIPTFDIDLDVEESHRWDEVITADTKDVLKLAEVAEAEYTSIPRVARVALRTIVSSGYRMSN